MVWVVDDDDDRVHGVINDDDKNCNVCGRVRTDGEEFLKLSSRHNMGPRNEAQTVFLPKKFLRATLISTMKVVHISNT